MRLLLPLLALLGTAPPQSARLPVSGGELAYEIAGPASAPAVVLLHGAFMDRGTWDPEFPVLAKEFRVVRYDIRPFGESTRPEKSYSVPDDLLRVLDHLKIARAFLIGHSFGGALAIDFALLHPDRVAGLVLVSASPNGFALPPDERQAGAAVFAAVKDGDDAVVKAWLEHPIWSVSRTRPEVLKALDAITRRNLAPFHMTFAPYIPVTPPAVERLAELKTPTLVVIGDRDTPGNQQGAELVAAKVAGASKCVIAGADHGVPVGWSDELISAAVGFMRAARR
jgi:3-oxoadipate enol-lactonase